MRALTNLMPESVMHLVAGERRYEAHGSIAFHFLRALPGETDLDKLQTEIEKVDCEFPWRDPGTRYAGTHLESIRGVHSIMVTDTTHPEKTVCEFRLVPGDPYLRKAQVHAYEKYLAKLAEELARRKLPGVQEVKSVMRWSSMASFKVV